MKPVCLRSRYSQRVWPLSARAWFELFSHRTARDLFARIYRPGGIFLNSSFSLLPSSFRSPRSRPAAPLPCDRTRCLQSHFDKEFGIHSSSVSQRASLPWIAPQDRSGITGWDQSTGESLGSSFKLLSSNFTLRRRRLRACAGAGLPGRLPLRGFRFRASMPSSENAIQAPRPSIRRPSMLASRRLS